MTSAFINHDPIETLRDEISNILFKTNMLDDDLLVDSLEKIMDKIQKCYGDELKQLNIEKNIVIERNLEMSKKLDCISFIMEDKTNE